MNRFSKIVSVIIEAPLATVIIAINLSSVASERAISPVTRPSRIVTMRSLMVITSGSSEEIASTAMPDRAMS